MSFNALSAVIFTCVDAGFALNQHSSWVNGLTPFLRGFAGFFLVLIFIRPGTLNEPGPFLPKSFLIIVDMQSKTEATSLRESPVSSEMPPKICDFVLGLTSAVFLAIEFESFLWSNPLAIHFRQRSTNGIVCLS